jgi:hypothetical protein
MDKVKIEGNDNTVLSHNEFYNAVVLACSDTSTSFPKDHDCAVLCPQCRKFTGRYNENCGNTNPVCTVNVRQFYDSMSLKYRKRRKSILRQNLILGGTISVTLSLGFSLNDFRNAFFILPIMFFMGYLALRQIKKDEQLKVLEVFNNMPSIIKNINK